jgi:hypothetical protein
MLEKKLYHALFIRKFYVPILKMFSYRHLSVILLINKIFHSDINELFLKFHEILNKFKNPLKDEN